MDGKYNALAMKAHALAQFNNSGEVWSENNVWSAHTHAEIGPAHRPEVPSTE